MLIPFYKILLLLGSIPWVVVLLAGACVVISIWKSVFIQKQLMPFNQNLLRIPQIGAFGIMGLAMPLLSLNHRYLLTGLSYILAFGLLVILCMLISETIRHWKRLLVSNNAIYSKWLFVAYLTLTSLLFLAIETLARCCDRYYLIAFAPILMGLAVYGRQVHVRLVNPLSVLLAILISFYSLAAVQDYMGWNRARWRAISKLEAAGVTYHDIDGGAEYNIVRGISIYGSDYFGACPRNLWRWWPVRGEKYIISFSPVPDYKIVAAESYWSALTWSRHPVLVLQQATSLPVDTAP
jgi:hypothetical protein